MGVLHTRHSLIRKSLTMIPAEFAARASL
jgi:hypothetical protein